MNTLRITKGSDAKIYADDTKLFFVTDFTAQQTGRAYPIREFLCDENVDTIILNPKYEIKITALSHLPKSVFEKDNFCITVCVGELTYSYLSCTLVSHTRVVNPSKPITDSYTIVADSLVVKKGCAVDE